MKTRWLVLLALPVSLLATPLLRAQEGGQPGTPQGFLRVERIFREFWVDGARGDVLLRQPPPTVVVPTPAGVDQIDVVMTVTMEYKTTPRDFGLIEAGLRPGADSLFEGFPLDYPLQSPSAGSFTSATLTWVERSLLAQGQTYEFAILPHAHDDNNNDIAEIRGIKLAYVIEMWPVDG